MEPEVWAAWAAVVVAVVAAGTGVRQARSASRAAGEAADQVAAAREQAEAAVRSAQAAEAAFGEARREATASERAAAAAERANELAESQIEHPEVAWTMEHFDGDRWQLRNIGDVPAYGVTVASNDKAMSVDGPTEAPVLRPTETIEPYIAISLAVRDQSVTVTWFDSSDIDPDGMQTRRVLVPPSPKRPRSGRVL